MSQSNNDPIQTALNALQWFVENDDTNIGQEGNEFWEEGLNNGIAAITMLKAAAAQLDTIELHVDSTRLDWYQSHPGQINNLGKTWYWCAGYGRPYSRASSLRSAIDAAIDAERAS